MCHREVMEAMLLLPTDERRKGLCQRSIIRQRWPELLGHPFNEATARQRIGLAAYRARWRLPSDVRRAVSALRHPREATLEIGNRIRRLALRPARRGLWVIS